MAFLFIVQTTYEPFVKPADEDVVSKSPVIESVCEQKPEEKTDADNDTTDNPEEKLGKYCYPSIVAD